MDKTEVKSGMSQSTDCAPCSHKLDFQHAEPERREHTVRQPIILLLEFILIILILYPNLSGLEADSDKLKVNFTLSFNILFRYVIPPSVWMFATLLLALQIYQQSGPPKSIRQTLEGCARVMLFITAVSVTFEMMCLL